MEKAPLPEHKELLRRTNRISLGHAEALDPPQAAERVLEEAIGAARSDLGFVAEADAPLDCGQGRSLMASSKVPWSRELGGLCEGGVEAAIDRVVGTGAAQVWKPGEGAPAATGLGCLAAIPLLHGGQPVAVLGLAWREGACSGELVERLEPLCEAATTLLRASADRYARPAREAEGRLLIERLRQLERLESLQCLASGVAHDMNNILVALLGNLDLVSNGLEGDELDRALLREDLEQVSAAGQRVSALADRLQGFGRRGASGPSSVQVGELLEALEPSLRCLAGEGSTLRVTAAAPLAGVSIDPQDLEVVLSCLVLNARESLGPGGVIRIEANDRAPGQVALTVSDDGCGMEEQELERATELFFSTRPLGAGLGLPTAERLLLLAGGKLEIASRPGEGTAVTLLLPASRGGG